MARRKDDSILDDAFELFKLTPFWVGPIFAVIGFMLFRYGVPMLMPPPKQGGVDIGILFRQVLPMLSWFVLAVLLLAWLMAETFKLKNRRLFDRQTGIGSIRGLSWRDFEHLVGEYYRRQGYLAEVIGTNGNDGGVDIVLNGRGERVLVQCKQWKAFKVGVQPIRELLGVVTSQRASRGVLVTSGRFTAEAVRFAGQNRTIGLVDGTEPDRMISSVRTAAIANRPSTATPPALPSSRPQERSTRTCPACGAGMVLRIARRGTNAGSQFWGCQSYPRCKGTVPA